MRFNALFKPKTKSPNPLRVHYEKLSLVDTSFFILIAKNTQRYQLIANTPLKTFYTLYKMRWNV